jgi:hypothetical protein
MERVCFFQITRRVRKGIVANMGEGDVSDPKFIILSHDSNRVTELVATT